MILFVKLFLAHIIGDFILQPTSWIEEKETRKIRSPKLYLHCIIHVLLTFILLADVQLWYIAVIVGFFHYLIDLLKLYKQRDGNKRIWFLADQLLHVITLISIAIAASGNFQQLKDIPTGNYITYITALLFLTRPASIIVKIVISIWEPEKKEPDTTSGLVEKNDADNTSLKDAGMYIGILERLYIFIFIMTGHWDAIGFLLAAKSVFRFGDLTAAKDRKLTEYVIIGTLISFGIAIVVSLLNQYILGQ